MVRLTDYALLLCLAFAASVGANNSTSQSEIGRDFAVCDLDNLDELSWNLLGAPASYRDPAANGGWNGTGLYQSHIGILINEENPYSSTFSIVVDPWARTETHPCMVFGDSESGPAWHPEIATLNPNGEWSKSYSGPTSPLGDLNPGYGYIARLWCGGYDLKESWQRSSSPYDIVSRTKSCTMELEYLEDRYSLAVGGGTEDPPGGG